MFEVGEMVTFLSSRGRILEVNPHCEDGYSWVTVRLRLDNGTEVEVDETDLDEALARREFA